MHAFNSPICSRSPYDFRETSCYHRCGRTDKGVSAFGQVISIDLRSNLLEGHGVKARPGGTAHERPGMP